MLLLSFIYMDPQTSYTLAIFSIFLFIIVKLKKRRNLKKTHPIPNIPPGPRKLPIVGNIPHLIGSAAPHRKLRELAYKYGSLMHLQLGEIFLVVVSSAEYAMEVMKTHDVVFASRPRTLTAKILFYDSTTIAYSPYGDYWKQLRKICATELLSTKRVQSHWPIRKEEMTNLIKRIALREGSIINLTQEIKSFMFTITSRIAFGKKYKQQEEYISLVREVSKLIGGFNIGDLFPSVKWLQNLTGMRLKLEKLHQKVDRILEIIINDHKEAKSRTKQGLFQGEEDLIDVLLNIEEGSSDKDFCLTSENIKAIIFDVFSGGSDTTTTTMSWAMAEMIKNSKVLKRAQDEVRETFERRGRVDETCIDELKYLKAVIKEVLRLHPPGPLLIPRECGKACEINGYHIPFKSKVIINVWAIGRDPKYWTEPESFYPERFLDSFIDYKGTNFEYIPFGAGRRICPGINYGVANVELALAFLLYYFDWTLPKGMKGEDLDMTEEYGGSVGRKEDLFLIPIVYPSLLVS